MKLLTLELVLRNWWRNKLFFFISLLSLTIGIACASLLVTFVIYEYAIEDTNPYRKELMMLTSDSPFEKGERVFYAPGEVPAMIREKFPEVEATLRMQEINAASVKWQNTETGSIGFIQADSALFHLFPYPIVAGNLAETLQTGKVAISESLARKLFGNHSPLGEILTIDQVNEKVNVQVGAVFKKYSRALLSFDMMKGIEPGFFGGTSVLLLRKGTDSQTLEKKIQKAKLPSLIPEQNYYLEPIQKIYFSEFKAQSLECFNHRNPVYLFVGLFAAIMILFIGIFNYLNLKFSQILQQIKMIYVQKLMGATRNEIRNQFFLDTFLMVFFSFVLAVLLIWDILPVFNSIVHSELDFMFFFSRYAAPVLILLVFLIAFLPAWIGSKRIIHMDINAYRQNCTSKGKGRFVSVMVIFQFAISLGLILASLTVNRQLALLEESGERYKNIIQIGNGEDKIPVGFRNELSNIGGIRNLALMQGSFTNYWLSEVAPIHTDPIGTKHFQALFHVDPGIFNTFSIPVLRGDDPETAVRKYGRAGFINESYILENLKPGTDPIGHYLSEYDTMGDSTYIICGIVPDFPINELERKIEPTFFMVENIDDPFFLQIKLEEQTREKTLAEIQRCWEAQNERIPFNYTDIHAHFRARNKAILDFSNLIFFYSVLSILLTCSGIMAIAFFAMKQQYRQIGIRKIHGASFYNLLVMYLSRFLIWLAIAFILAMPITVFLITRWLEYSANRVSLRIIDCVYALAIVLFVVCMILLPLLIHFIKISPVKILRQE